MAETEERQSESQEESNGHRRSNGGTRSAVSRAAPFAAAGIATALAARRAFSDRGGTETKPERKLRGSEEGGASVLTSMATSAWDSARDSLVPMMEDAATHAGEYLARNGPEIVRESLIPRFISGFERAQKSSDEE
jgi:hypothetical protein